MTDINGLYICEARSSRLEHSYASSVFAKQNGNLDVVCFITVVHVLLKEHQSTFYSDSPNSGHMEFVGNVKTCLCGQNMSHIAKFRVQFRLWLNENLHLFQQ